MIAHLGGSKGWMFWVPETDKLISLAWATFEDILGPRMVQQSHMDPVIQAKLTIHPTTNAVSLGDFSQELAFEREERLVDEIIKTCGFYMAGIPKTFKQAQKSSDWEHWKKNWVTLIESKFGKSA